VDYLPAGEAAPTDYYPRIDRKEAVARAGAVLKERFNKNAADYKVGVSAHSIEDAEASFVKRFAPLTEAERILLGADGVSYRWWSVQFKRQYDPEIIAVLIDQVTGETYTSHEVADTAVGAELTADSARTLATAAFREAEASPDDYKLIEESRQKKDHRVDHGFTWETIRPLFADTSYGPGHYRRRVRIIGDEVEPGPRKIKAPEAWERYEKEKTPFWIADVALSLALILGGGIWGVILFGRRVARREVRWRAGLIAGAILGGLQLLAIWNNLPGVWAGYITSFSIVGFMAIAIVAMVIAAMAIGLAALAVVSLAEALSRGRWGVSPWMDSVRGNRRAAEDGAAVVLAGIGVMFGVKWLLGTLGGGLSLPIHTYSIPTGSHLECFHPWLALVGKSAISAFLGMPLIYAAFVLLDTSVRRGWLRWLILLLAAVAFGGASGNAHLTAGEFLWRLANMGAVIAAGYLILKYWIGPRLWALVFGAFLISMVRGAVTYLGWEHSAYYTQGWVAGGVAAAGAILMVVALKMRAAAARDTIRAE
jgi:hypothetical protein